MAVVYPSPGYGDHAHSFLREDTMTVDQLEQTMRQAAGNPSSGAVADIIPTLAAAIHATMQPQETRVIHANETR